MLRQIQPEQEAEHIFEIGPHQITMTVTNRKIAMFTTGRRRSDMIDRCVWYVKDTGTRQALNGNLSLHPQNQNNVRQGYPQWASIIG